MKKYQAMILSLPQVVSYPLTGSTGDGYSLAKELGHTIITPKPSLEISENGVLICKVYLFVLSISIRNINTIPKFIRISVKCFTISSTYDYSSASSHIRDCKSGQYIIELDLKPALSREQLDARILRDGRNFH